MKVLIIGSGGREHALAWKIRKSPLVKDVYCAPGNHGMADVATLVNIKADDILGLREFVRKERVDLTVVGPEIPLTLGIVDYFCEHNLKIVGPSKSASQIEGSKVFTRQLLKKYDIPSPSFEIFSSPEKAMDYVRGIPLPVVVKADGLAAGKGVMIATSLREAEEAIRRTMVERSFGDAGKRVVVEEHLEGEEVSFIAFTDGENILPMSTSQDHKRVFDGDRGPNTGGMGAYSPAPIVDPVRSESLWTTAESLGRTSNGVDERLDCIIMDKIMTPTVKALESEGMKYRGILYAGLMIKNGEPKVLEFNARLGDPETQPLLMRMKGDIVPILLAIADGKLGTQVVKRRNGETAKRGNSEAPNQHSEIRPITFHESVGPKSEISTGMGLSKEGKLCNMDLKWDLRNAVCIVMASGGYPGPYEKGKVIKGLEEVSKMKDVVVFHAGTTIKQGEILTNGGRVLGVTALGEGLRGAIDLAYKAVDKISWDGVHYRKDIGAKGLGKGRVGESESG